MPAWLSPAAARDGLAVAVTGDELLRLLVPTTDTEGEDVHAAVAGSTCPEDLENNIDDSLRGQWVLPAHTAALLEGFRMVSSGTITVTGSMQPSFV
jgi:hypothetical protein